MQKKTLFGKLMLPLTLVCVLGVGFIIGQRLKINNIQYRFETFQNWNKLNAVLSIIATEYVDTINNKVLEEKTISSILKTLDPHSVYIPAQQFKAMNEDLSGSFEGVGITFNMLTDTVLVISTVAGGPSEREGVLAGDKIITVNDSTIAGCRIPQDSIMRLLRGERGSQVRIGIKRSGEKDLIPFTITRNTIPLKSVDAAYMLAPDVGYIRLSKFSRTAYDEVMEAVQKLQRQGMLALTLDLRNNGGGYLDQALDLLNEFFESKMLLVYTEGKSHPRQNYIADGNGDLKSVPVVILIDENSASASEIVAGAIQDNDRGTIVGRRSFGKGLVQEPINFPDGSGLRLTTARYYTPTGRSIQRPYNQGDEEDYYRDIVNRYEHGEFMTGDSIVHNKEMQYKTQGGKTVYGGGGITPDIFVPVDTTGIKNEFFQNVWRKNLVYRFALQFVDANRKKLREIETVPQLKRYLYYRNFDRAFIAYVGQQGISAPDEKQFKECRALLNVYIKAFIARNTSLEDTGFYMFLNLADNNVQEAIKILSIK